MCWDGHLQLDSKKRTLDRMLLDFCLGGDFILLIKKGQTFSEEKLFI